MATGWIEVDMDRPFRLHRLCGFGNKLYGRTDSKFQAQGASPFPSHSFHD